MILDPNGRYVILDITLDPIRLTLVNVYGPNSDDVQFFVNLSSQIDELPNDLKIIGGDFNVIVNNNMDKVGGKPEHAHIKSQKIIQEWLQKYEVIDIWRTLNPNKLVYTWKRGNSVSIACRLDYFFNIYKPPISN